MISAWDIEHLEEIIFGHGDWFTAQLIRLIVKADFENRAKLAEVFPEEVLAVERWLAGGGDPTPA